jgi:hypothetical protein
MMSSVMRATRPMLHISGSQNWLFVRNNHSEIVNKADHSPQFPGRTKVANSLPAARKRRRKPLESLNTGMEMGMASLWPGHVAPSLRPALSIAKLQFLTLNPLKTNAREQIRSRRGLTTCRLCSSSFA